MKRIRWCLCTVCIAGCISLQQTVDSDAPQLLYQTPLPAYPASIQRLPTEITLAVYVLENGTVEQVRISKSSSARWDSLAMIAIKQWRFSPARTNGRPFSTWFHMRAPLHYTGPLSLFLAEILCMTKAAADSIYEALERGQDFGVLARRCSIDTLRETGGVIGEVNIFCYPENIRGALKQLDIGEYTKPLLYGNQYILFQRIKKAD